MIARWVSGVQKPSVLFKEIIAEQIKAGNDGDPYAYDTRPGAPVTTDVIDPYSGTRQWTYQFCTQFGWYQTVSEE